MANEMLKTMINLVTPSAILPMGTSFVEEG